MVVVQNDIGNKYSPTTIVAPLTTKLKREMPTHVKIGSLERHNMRPSTIMLEHIRTVDKSRLGKYVTKLNDSIIRRIDKAIAISFGIDGSAFGN
jgi:mRNA interferase MazF